MSNEKNFFEQQIASLRNLTSIHQYLEINASTMDASSILRAEYVLIVSAFDNYLHSIVRRKIRENFFSSQYLPNYLSLPIADYLSVHNAGNISLQQQLLDVSIKRCLEKDSYQSPASVEYALSLLNIKKIWSSCSSVFGDTGDNVKNRLALIIQRRNQIAQESDMDVTGIQRSINSQTINDCREFFLKFVSVIDSLIV